MSGADTAWILTSTALVLFMTLPGLALFYAGLVRAHNVLSVLMNCFAIACVMSVVWFALGYTIAFGDGGASNDWWGGIGKAFLAGVGLRITDGPLFWGIVAAATVVGYLVGRTIKQRWCSQCNERLTYDDETCPKCKGHIRGNVSA